jgi:hypothetical protein
MTLQSRSTSYSTHVELDEAQQRVAGQHQASAVHQRPGAEALQVTAVTRRAFAMLV